MKKLLFSIAAFLVTPAFAQDAPKPPERNELYWCQQQRNFAFDNAASNAAAAARLEDQLKKVQAELDELKKQKGE